ncbi:hypothetical protein [Lacrimispora sp. HJ1]|uniref:hypothetical protein n=1 Tax=Lacrimispora sp. HJ1 TaxID=3243293 RepID=UPI00376FB1DA
MACRGIKIKGTGLGNKRRKELMNMIAVGILLFVIICELAAIYGKMEEKKHE